MWRRVRSFVSVRRIQLILDVELKTKWACRLTILLRPEPAVALVEQMVERPVTLVVLAGTVLVGLA
jgi:hypothetical protein